ncbi:hypothetical protein AKJ09_10053 [Labilithrix luteola]|uniref:Uncharacterized protein n=2 Tax=Labilithrix luteola TaxID=1391654 RepID=A0A0K1QD82_9BACT|nr:hypothetical protein AKJ09_10053 [Labilithrix luteola]
MFGVTPSPERIVFRCIRCKRSLGSSRDPALLHKKRMPDAPSRGGTGSSGSAETAPESQRQQ